MKPDLSANDGITLLKDYFQQVESQDPFDLTEYDMNATASTTTTTTVSQGETKDDSLIDVTPVIVWLTEVGVNTTAETLGPVLTKLKVSSVLELASLNDEGLQQVVAAMKKNRQKKWVKNDVPSKLASYLSASIVEASSKTTVAEWLKALSLSESGAVAWLNEEGYDDELSDLKELEEEEKQAFIAAAAEGGLSATHGVRVKRALEEFAKEKMAKEKSAVAARMNLSVEEIVSF